MTQRVLVCGGRDFTDRALLFEKLDRLHAFRGIAVVIQGGAAGADDLAADWAVSRRVPCQVFRADWKTHGKAAGPIRNTQMLTEGKPDCVIAFHGGKGTRNMLAQARRVGLPTTHIEKKP